MIPEERSGVKGTPRFYRDRLAAVRQYVYELHAPINEGYRHPPKFVDEGLVRLLEVLVELDREYAKTDREAVAGEVVLREVAPCEIGRPGR